MAAEETSLPTNDTGAAHPVSSAVEPYDFALPITPDDLPPGESPPILLTESWRKPKPPHPSFGWSILWSALFPRAADPRQRRIPTGKGICSRHSIFTGADDVGDRGHGVLLARHPSGRRQEVESTACTQTDLGSVQPYDHRLGGFPVRLCVPFSD